MTVAFATFGCKVNQYDTQTMLEGFLERGWQVKDFGDICQAYVINTCTVTATGANKSLKAVRQAARRNPGAAVVVAGCLSQREGEKLLEMPGVRLVLGTTQRLRAAELLQQALERGVSLCAVEVLTEQPFEDARVTAHEQHTRAVLKIQDGCENRCAYCAIPDARGPVRSRPMPSIRLEAARLGEAGYREVVVTGIHLCSYGRDLAGVDLLDALEAVCGAPGIVRVRLGSLEPSFITCRAAERLAAQRKLCHHFHLSLQSGSDRILALMGRRYTTARYAEAVETLRRAMPGCSITTDVIAGFPGEDDKAFEETMDFVREIGFSRIHVFPYSDREGTPAASFAGSVPMEERRDRAGKLILLAREMEERYGREQMGRVLEVLFEEEGEGLSREYLTVRAKGGMPGEVRRVRVTGVEGVELIGALQE